MMNPISVFSSSEYLKSVLMALSMVALIVAGSQHVVAQQAVPIAKASCGPTDKTESGLQGQATLAERFSPPQAYNCNLNLVAKFAGEGGSFHTAEFDHCAYYSTTPNPELTHPGTVVIDASNSQHLEVSYLTSPAMLKSNESLEVNTARKLLVGADFMGSTFEVYDLSGGCSHPVLKGSLDLHDFTPHGGNLTADGRTYYAANYPWDEIRHTNAGVVAIDVSDPSKPRELARWKLPGDWNPHAATVSSDGNRVYLVSGIWSQVRLTTLDTSELQARRPGAQFRTVSVLPLDATGGQFATPITIKKHPYVFLWGVRPPPSKASGCSQDNIWGAPYGVPWVVDIADEKNPKPISYWTLEVNDPANCPKIMLDPTIGIGYMNMHCSADNEQDAKMLACGYTEGGLRVFDIRDVNHPTEIAYYKPPAWRTRVRKGSFYGIFGGVFTSPGAKAAAEAAKKAGTLSLETNDHTTDITLFPRFHNQDEIWFLSTDGGFHIVRFSDRIKAAEKDLFRD
jgi:hypothetical protein